MSYGDVKFMSGISGSGGGGGSSLSNLTVIRRSADLLLTTADSGKLYTNGGSSGGIIFTLPAAAPGLFYYFLNEGGGFNIRLKPNGADTITQGGLVTTPTTGHKDSTNGGDGVMCASPVAGKWYFMLFSGNNWNNT